MQRRAYNGVWMRAAAVVVAAGVVLVWARSADGRLVEAEDANTEGPLLSVEGPLLPRSSGPRSSRTLVPSAGGTPVEVTLPEVLEAAGTEDEREGAGPKEETSTLRAFLDEMLEQGSLWKVLPLHMGTEARGRFLEDRAVRTYREGIFRFRGSACVPAAHMRIASIYAQRGNRGAALREYEEVLERFARHEVADEARLARARLLFEAADYAGARDEGYLLVDTYVDSPLVADAYLLVGRAHELLGELEEAHMAYTHVVQRTRFTQERSIRAREGLASIELARGNADGAIEIYQQLLAQAPSQSVRDARQFKVAGLCLEAGETGHARTLLRQILGSYELNSYRPAAAFLLGESYYVEGDMAQAAQAYASALFDFPNYEGCIPALFHAADAYAHLMLYEDALALVGRVRTWRNPSPTPRQRAQAKVAAGEILLLDGRYGAALEEFYGSLVGELTSSERRLAAYRIAQAYYRSGYYNEALDAFGAALEQAPHHELALEASLAAADCAVKKGWVDEARQRYTAILDAASEDDTPEQRAARSRAVFRLLDTYADRGLTQDELSCAQELLARKGPHLDEARLLYRVARAYERLNNPGQATVFYEQVCARHPGSTWAEQAAVKIRHMQMLKQLNELAR